MCAAKIIKRHIDENGIKLKYLAEKTGISKELLRRSLEGTRVLKADEFIKICEVLSIDLDKFSEIGINKAG